MAKNKKILLIVGTIVLLVVIATICLFAFKDKEKAIYIVTFNSNGGSAISEQNIEEGMSATKPQDPIRNGYIFIEWLLNGESYDFDNIVDKNIELSAKWEEIVPEKELVTIIFNSDGGTTIANAVVEKGSKVEKPIDPTKDGYTFAEWQLFGVKYDFELEVTDNLELVAKWKEVKINNNKNTNSTNNSNANNSSPNDNEEQKETDNIHPETPTLSSPAGATEPDGIWAQLSIVYEGAYSYSPRHPQLDGYELYEKNGSQYKLIHTSETEFKAEVTVDIGESKTYVARVYTYNKSNKKIYSNYSNEIVIK